MATYNYIVLSGVIEPDSAQVYADTVQDWKGALGSGLNVSPSTPQGVLITLDVSARLAMARNNAVLANQINPNIAGGVFLDAIMALTGSRRSPAVYSSVICTLTGIPGTVIPAGVQVRTTIVPSAVFQSTTIVTLDAGGIATVLFQAITAGPIPAPAGTLTDIVPDTAILGWETVNNLADATLGVETQSDEAARALRRNTLASQGSSIAEAVLSAIYNTPGVRSARFLENVTSATQIIEGVTMVPHSMWACVDGGTDLAVATAINSKKGGGCDYNGAVAVPVIDPTSGQAVIVLFDRPELIGILIRATVKANNSFVDPEGAVREAILKYVDGLIDGEAGFVVGASVSPFELSGAVNILYPEIYVQKMEVSLVSTVSFITTEIPIEIYQKAFTSASSITVILA